MQFTNEYSIKISKSETLKATELMNLAGRLCNLCGNTTLELV